jgi:hypothetical protein
MATDTQPPSLLPPPSRVAPSRLVPPPSTFLSPFLSPVPKGQVFDLRGFRGQPGPKLRCCAALPFAVRGRHGHAPGPVLEKNFDATDFSSCQYLISTVRGGAAACMAQLGGGFNARELLKGRPGERLDRDRSYSEGK